MTVLTYAPVRDHLYGWCAACHRAGRFVPAVDELLQACRAHLRLLPRRPVLVGQLALDVDAAPLPPALRTPHETGVQLCCADCVARGAARPRMGLPQRTPGDAMPLCLTCWRSRSDRARRGDRRGLGAVEAGWVAELTERLACEACGPEVPRAPGEDLLPPAAVEARRRRRRRERTRGPQRRRARRRVGCWRCADGAWLEAARAVHDYDVAQTAGELERVDRLAGEHKAVLARVRRAGQRLHVVTQWRERVGRVVAALPRLTKTGPRGRLQVARGAGAWSRAWELLADFLARDDAERTGRGVSGRGRPPEYPRVVAVMAIAASHESGHGSMVGLSWTALFADVGPRTVTTGWARTVELGCAELVERGRILTVEERRELRRHRQRAVYDFKALHRSPIDAQPYLAAAAMMLAQLLERATRLVNEHQTVVDEAVAAATAVEAELLDVQAWLAEQGRDDLALQALVDPAWADAAKAAAETARVTRARATRAAAPPVDPGARIAAQRAARAAGEVAGTAVDNAFEQARRMATFCDHPRKGFRKRISSCLSSGVKNSATADVTATGGQRPDGRGEDQHLVGASRSSTTRVTTPTAPSRPRTVKRICPDTPHTAARPTVMWWAKPLAQALAARWTFLEHYLNDADDGHRSSQLVARERGLRVRMIAATIGSRLGPQWSAAEVVRLVERHAGVHSVIAPGDAHSPLRYLAVMLDRALTNPDAQVPHHSPVRQAYERDVLATDLATAAARTAVLRDELDQREVAAAAERCGPRTGLAAARHAAATAHGPAPARSGYLGDRDQIARARTELAIHRSRQSAVDDRAGSDADWPTVREPGGGLSHRLEK